MIAIGDEDDEGPKPSVRIGVAKRIAEDSGKAIQRQCNSARLSVSQATYYLSIFFPGNT